MKRICRSLVILASVAALCGSAMAQSEPGGPAPQGPMGGAHNMGKRKMMPQTPKERLKRMATRLGLSEEQKSQILPILEEEAAKMKALREDSSLSRKECREKMQAIRREMHDRITPILTPEQQKKQEEMLERAKAKKERCKGMGPGPGMEQKPQ